jgi:hypothetical protein
MASLAFMAGSIWRRRTSAFLTAAARQFGTLSSLIAQKSSATKRCLRRPRPVSGVTKVSRECPKLPGMVGK